MDSTYDDFGELYVDEKVQASAAFAGDVGFTKSCEESECAAISEENKGFEGTVEPESLGEMKKVGVVAKGSGPCVNACAANLTEENEESEYSDSEDDLNIVLKDDDSKVLPAACGSNTNNGGYVDASQTCLFQKRRIGNWCTMPNAGIVNESMTMEASANDACIDSSPVMPHCGYNNSHPWSRTIFDANFDVFIKKPWKNPGTDINDFFNFGFNEQSWKDYCKPLGRAIEVEGGTLERIPSVDLRRPRDSDPDVVIQIPVTNDVEKLSSMTSMKAKPLSITSNEASRSEELHSDKGKDMNSSGDSMKEEASVECQDENTESFRGEQFPSKENCCSREVTPCDKEIIVEKKEESYWNSGEAGPSSVERESSLGDHIRFSPTSSYSEGKTEESEGCERESSKGGAIDDQGEVSTPPRRTKFAEHEANSIKSRERSGIKHSRYRRSHEDPSKRHCGRANYGVYRRIKHRIVKDASPRPDPDMGEKKCSRHGISYRYPSKDWQNGPHFTLGKVGTEGKGFPMSNREKWHGRSYSSVDFVRDREHRFGRRNNIETSQGRSFDHSNGYKYEVRREEYTSRSSFNLSQRSSRLSFKEEEDGYDWQHFERKYGRERSPGLAYESNKERYRYDWLSEPCYQGRIPVRDMDYRNRLEYSSAHGRDNPKQSHENHLRYGRRGDYDYNFNRHRYEDGVHRAESQIPFELAYKEMHSFAEVGRRGLQGYERNEEFSEIDKRRHYTPDLHLDRFVSEKDGYKYRIQDGRPSPSLSLRDSWYTKGSRGHSWGDDTRDSTTMEAYDSHNSQLYKDAPRDGWTRNLVHKDNVSIQDRLTYDDDWVRQDRGRYQLEGDIQCSVREVTHSEHPSYTDERLVCDTRMSTHNRISTKQRSGYAKSRVHETDERHHRSKKMRRDGHAFNKCQDPVDLTDRQGKLCNQSRRRRRFSNGGDTIEEVDRQKTRNVIGRGDEKAVVEVHRGLNDKEEGEIIEEARDVKGIEIDEERIQESLKKMEKRRERFKGTEFSRTSVTTFDPQTEPGAKTDDTNPQRPVRKRRWCASAS